MGEAGIEHTAGSLPELLDDPGVEAVVVATPNDLHVPMALAAVAAGKPVLIDKPVSVDLPGGLTVLRAGAQAGAEVGVAHHARRLAGVRAAARWLASPAGGTPRLVHADFSNARGATMAANAWHRRVRGSEAGVLIQVGIHQIDNVLYLNPTRRRLRNTRPPCLAGSADKPTIATMRGANSRPRGFTAQSLAGDCEASTISSIERAPRPPQRCKDLVGRGERELRGDTRQELMQ